MIVSGTPYFISDLMHMEVSIYAYLYYVFVGFGVFFLAGSTVDLQFSGVQKVTNICIYIHCFSDYFDHGIIVRY